MGLTGQVAIVTGAGQGIGRAVAEALAGEGVQVALVARTEADVEAGAEACRAHGVRALPLVGDVADRAFVEAAVARVETELGPVDLLVNNAGRTGSWEGPLLWESDPEDWWGRVETNLLGSYLFARYVLPGMVERGRGRVLAMNSLAGSMPLPMTDGAYPVSKAGLFRLTDQLASQLTGSGVVVLDLSPGLVATKAVANPQVPEHLWTPVTKICALVIRAADGELDALSGRFVHAEDDIDLLVERADAIGASRRARAAHAAGVRGRPQGADRLTYGGPVSASGPSGTSGYSGTPLPRKLGIKAGHLVLVEGAPARLRPRAAA